MALGRPLESGVTKLPAHYAIFAREMVLHGNKTRAALAAGSKDSSATKNGYTWAARAEVIAEMQRIEKLPPTYESLTEERILTELARNGFANFDDFLDEEGDLVGNLKMLDRGHLAAVGSIKETTRQFGDPENPVIIKTKELKFNSKLEALKMAMQNKGMFEKDNQQSRTAVQINLG